MGITSSAPSLDHPLDSWQKKVVRAGNVFLRRLPGSAHAIQIGDTRVDGETGAITTHPAGTPDPTHYDRHVVFYYVQSDSDADWQFDSIEVYVELPKTIMPDSPDVLRAIGKAMASLYGSRRATVAIVHINSLRIMRRNGDVIRRKKGVSRSFKVTDASNVKPFSFDIFNRRSQQKGV